MCTNASVKMSRIIICFALLTIGVEKSQMYSNTEFKSDRKFKRNIDEYINEVTFEKVDVQENKAQLLGNAENVR